MAATETGAALTEAHRVVQAEIRNRAAAELLVVWPLLDLDDLDGSVRQWLAAARPIVIDSADQSARVAGRYFREFRAAEGAAGEVDMPTIAPPDRDRVDTSLVVTGPVQIKKTQRTAGFDLAVSRARALSSQAGARHAINAGRNRLITATDADPAALFYSRVTSGSPCGFCAMLASRGAVYGGRDSASFRPHDRCGCQPEPGYQNGAVSASSSRYRALWDDLTSSGEFSSEQLPNAFRRAVEA